MAKFKVGDVVKIKVNTKHYGQDTKYNPADLMGVVESVNTPDEEGYMYDVVWPDNYSNVYRPEDLDLVTRATTLEHPAADFSELTEAYAKIDTLEEALEDAVKRLENYRRGLPEIWGLCEVTPPSTKSVQFKLAEEEIHFKPINEMTLEDWELAKQYGWMFEMRNLGEVRVTDIDYDENKFPICFNGFRWRTLQGLEWTSSDRDEEDCDIIKRIK